MPPCASFWGPAGKEVGVGVASAIAAVAPQPPGRSCFASAPKRVEAVCCVDPNGKPCMTTGESMNNLYSLYKNRDKTFKPAGEVTFSRMFASQRKGLKTFLSEIRD